MPKLLKQDEPDRERACKHIGVLWIGPVNPTRFASWFKPSRASCVRPSLSTMDGVSKALEPIEMFGKPPRRDNTLTHNRLGGSACRVF
jgi:hypothetical protein